MKYQLSLLFILSILINCNSQQPKTSNSQPENETAMPQPFNSEEAMAYAEKIYDELTLDERIGQLFMVAAYSNKNAAHEAEIKRLIKEEHIGGLIFMQDNPERQLRLTNDYQAAAKVPLLIGMDGEWDLAMRLKNVNAFPYSMTLGAIQNDSLLFEMGQIMAKHHKRLGVHMNFAPVVDVNTNPDNPIIGNRSFGSDPNNVAIKGQMIAAGMQSEGVLACAKHFPGHGDTDKDSHKTLPTVGHDQSRLDSIELKPFKELIESGVAAIMAAHLNVPAMEPNPKFPSSLSKKVLTNVLKNEFGFEGLIVTDALNMQAVAGEYPAGEVDKIAFVAGNDILLFSQNVKLAKQKIKAALESGEITEERLKESVIKILKAKHFTGAATFEPLQSENLMADLNDQSSKVMNRKLYEAAVTVIGNNNFLPINDFQKKVAVVTLEENDHAVFLKYLNKYVNAKKISITSPTALSQLNDFDLVVIGVFKSTESPFKSYKISSNTSKIIEAIATKKPTVLSLFTSPYALKNTDLSQLKSTILAYQNNDTTQSIVPQVIFGALAAPGKCPVQVNESIKAGKGDFVQNNGTLGFINPDELGLDAVVLEEINDLANDALQTGSTPGLQVLAAKDGKVFFEKAYGFTTYEETDKVTPEHLYDIASVTKITASVPLIMKQVSDGKLNLDNTLQTILPESAAYDKGSINLRDLLAHQSGLTSWIGFYKNTLDTKNGRLYLDFYSRTPNQDFNVEVQENIYIKTDIRDSIRQWIYESPMESKTYRYSDLGYYLWQDYLEQSMGKTLDQLLSENFLRPLGMNRTAFTPYKYFDLKEIVPTEQDDRFRMRLVHGRVHDEGAALQGGVAGHAGLFSTAWDLAKMMQMYLNGGYYAGKRFVKDEVLLDFTTYQFKEKGNRRGLGFDKPALNNRDNTCGCTSSESFGHTGFTGTMVWADPETQFLYVFLSNRVHPDSNNKKLQRKDFRGRMQEVFYKAMQNLE